MNMEIDNVGSTTTVELMTHAAIYRKYKLLKCQVQ